MAVNIKHIWFDFSETIAIPSEAHDKLLYETYASVVGKPVSSKLKSEYRKEHEKHKSNSAVFNYLGLPAGYWSGVVNSKNPIELYKLADPNIPVVLDKLRQMLPISIFSNMRMDILLPAMAINPKWFTNFLSSADLKKPKPNPEGFYKIVEMSNLPANQVLFIGDSVEKEDVTCKEGWSDHRSYVEVFARGHLLF